jgi:DNA polymerase elongation subunit (family B)
MFGEPRVNGSVPRVLDFDTECRPMHYSEYRAESQITGIAWSWVGDDRVHCEVLQQDLSDERTMIANFVEGVLNHADVVTGHYIRKHDLPLLTDHCIRLGVELPKPVMVQDTMEIAVVKGLGKSQENLAATFGLSAEKHHMNGASWRVANSLSELGREGTRKRVMADVVQHKQLRAELLDRGLLKPPRRWSPR